jgi:hypothetical protein
MLLIIKIRLQNKFIILNFNSSSINPSNSNKIPYSFHFIILIFRNHLFKSGVIKIDFKDSLIYNILLK